jgi:nicotinamide-nucleotide amidase
MRASIITVGDEIVSGQTVDTNSAYLAANLAELGVVVSQIVSTGDDVDQIAELLNDATRTMDLVLVTGGLGPTHDDRTKKAAAIALSKKMVIDESLRAEIEDHLSRGAVYAPQVIQALAMIPEGSETIRNPRGTAAGLMMIHKRTRIYLLPGVPAEMKAVFEGRIIRDIRSLSGHHFIKTRLLRTVGVSESGIAERLGSLTPALRVKLAFLPGEIGVDLRLTAAGDDEDAVLHALESAAREMLPLLGRCVYSQEGEELHMVVGEMLIERGKTISIAESCTGGLISHLLTEVPGISGSLERGIVAYSNLVKTETLHVAGGLIDQHGAVSQEVAEAMACGVRKIAGTDLGLSTTGIAGPTGGSEAKPVGLVYMGLAHRDGCEVIRKVFSGTRERVKQRAAAKALEMVRQCLLDMGG